MRTSELVAMGWLIGYFILWWPSVYAIDQGSLIEGLGNGIIGLTITILILLIGNKWERKNMNKFNVENLLESKK